MLLLPAIRIFNATDLTMGFSQKLSQLTQTYDNATYIDPWHGSGRPSRIYLRCQNFVYKWCKQIIAFGALSAIVFGFVILIVMIKYANEGSKMNTSSLEFALYKNTFYNSCSKGNSRACDIPKPKIVSGTSGNTSILYWDVGLMKEDFCACFQDYKLVPSKPRQSAFVYNGLSIWLTQTVTLGTGLYILMSLVMMAERWEEYAEEREIAKHSWALFLYDIIQFIMWWVGFIMLAHSPASASPVAILSWITPFRYMYSLASPPLSNRISKEPANNRSTLVRIMGIITAIQWIASASTIGITHIFGLGTIRGEPQFIRYNFQASMFDSAPGSSACSISDVQDLTGLFTSPLVSAGRYSSSNVAYMISFVFNSIAAAVGAWRFFFSEHTLYKGLGGTMFILLLTDYIILVISVCQTSEAVSTILFNQQCNVIHITMSPNKGYMDVSGFSKGWRAVKGWFSV